MLLLGLTMSLGHCLGMCGPLVTAFSLRQDSGRGRSSILVPSLVYHFGRIGSYSILGAVVGFLGSTVEVMAGGTRIQGIFALAVSASLVALAAAQWGLLPWSTHAWTRAWGQQVSRTMQRLFEVRGLRRCAGLGMANGCLPCGPVYAAAVAAAATASVVKGAVAMALFGVGTLPVLLIFGLSAHRWGANLRLVLRRASGGILLLVAAQLGLRGLAVLGLVGHFRIGELMFW